MPLLLPRAGALWSLPALAPLLGAVALGPAFVALGGSRARASGSDAAAPRRRSRAAGFVSGWPWPRSSPASALLFGPADGTLPRADWQGSLGGAATDALAPLLSSGVLVVALVWAAFAVVLPLLVRGRQLVLDVLGAALWAMGLIVAQQRSAICSAGTTALDQARGAVAGPILGRAGAPSPWRPSRPARGATAPAPSDYPAMPR